MPTKSPTGPLAGKIALVAGATRGAGRGIAVALGEAGATVWCTGRSVSGHTSPDRPETIEETAAQVTDAGGEGIWRRVDHTDADAVAALFAEIRRDHGGLDLLVNDIWGGDSLTHWGPIWEHSLSDGLKMLNVGINTHLINAHYGAPLLRERPGAMLVEITDGVGEHYRGTVFYDLVKASTRRLALAFNTELSPTGQSAVAVTPGFLRSEAVLDHFGVTASSWQDAPDPHFAQSETPRYVGRGIAALMADTDHARFGGTTLSSGMLARLYDLTDLDGRRPDFGAYARDTLTAGILTIPEADRAAAFADINALTAVVGELAMPFVGVGGDALLIGLRSGRPVAEIVAETVKIG